MSKEKWNNYKSQTNEKRSKMLTVRLTPTDLELVKNGAKICDMSTSDFVMNLLRQKDFTQTLALKNEFKNVFQELVRVDQNFNQAVKNLNISKSDKASQQLKNQRYAEFENVLFSEHEERQKAYRALSQLLQKMSA